MASPAMAFTPAKPWPPADGPGVLFVHYGEEHWNDADGETLLPKIVEVAAEYKPKLVTMSGDKDNDGETDQLEQWREIMSAYDRRRRPLLRGRRQPRPRRAARRASRACRRRAASSHYQEVFKERPYPMGDGAPYDDPPSRRASGRPSDPAGAATHYFVDYGDVRWIFIDNSCWEITDCDTFQMPSCADAGGRGPVRLPRARRAGGHGRGQGRVRRHAHADRRTRATRATATRSRACTRWARAPRPDNGTLRVGRRRRPASTASSSATSRASSCTRARATSRTTSTAARAASCTPTARSAPTTATGTASGWCGWTASGSSPTPCRSS